MTHLIYISFVKILLYLIPYSLLLLFMGKNFEG